MMSTKKLASHCPEGIFGASIVDRTLSVHSPFIVILCGILAPVCGNLIFGGRRIASLLCREEAPLVWREASLATRRYSPQQGASMSPFILQAGLSLVDPRREF
jgi:hypothetical protein